MGRPLWCRHEGCGFEFYSIAGDLPIRCPLCEQEGAWTSEPPLVIHHVEYALTHNDKRFLKAAGIAPT